MFSIGNQEWVRTLFGTRAGSVGDLSITAVICGMEDGGLVKDEVKGRRRRRRWKWRGDLGDATAVTG